jgi:F-type H+-transporting ATPase subunit delta
VAVAQRIYAEALFDAAKEQGRLLRVREELADFVAAVKEVPELRLVLRNPQLEPKAKIDVLTDLLGGADELLRNFLLLAAEKGRIGQVEQIGAEFERLMAREERRLTVELTTARELSDAEAAEIVAQIERASGRKVEATRRVDPALIGGIVLRAGSLQADASVRGRLERLRNELVGT